MPPNGTPDGRAGPAASVAVEAGTIRPPPPASVRFAWAAVKLLVEAHVGGRDSDGRDAPDGQQERQEQPAAEHNVAPTSAACR